MNTPLFGRDAQLTAIADVLAAGKPDHLVLSGISGAGKSALLDSAAGLAVRNGHRVLWAGAHPLEQDYAFGLVRQLFQPIIAELSDADRAALFAGAVAPAVAAVWPEPGPPAEAGDAHFAVPHALYWLAVRLAEQGPIVLVVDDVQWADEASLRWLAYLAGRADPVPLLLIAARTTGMRGGQEALVDQLTGHLRPVAVSGLSEPDVAAFARAALKAEPEHGFVAACREVTGGNAFLLGELLATLAAEDVPPTEDAITRLAEFSPHGVSRWVLTRIRRADPDASAACAAVAEAMAILGESAFVPVVAAVAGLPEETVERAADLLSHMGLLRGLAPMRFAHAIVRGAVDGEIPAGRRRTAHAQAARVLDTRRGDAERVAAHLLACDPIGEPWAADALRRAARQALHRGVAEPAGRYLRRALAESGDETTRVVVTAELGRAALSVDLPSAVAHLTDAFDAVVALPRESWPDRLFTATVAKDLTLATGASGNFSMGRDVLDQVAAALGDSEPQLVCDLEAYAIGAGVGIPGFPHEERLARLRERAAAFPDSARLAAALTAHHRSGTGTGRERVVEDLRRAWELPTASAIERLGAFAFCAAGLCRADEFDLAARFSEALVAESSVAGQPMFAELGHALHGVVAFHTGRLTDALDEARAAIELRDSLSGGHWPASGWEGHLIRVHLARGEFEEAERLLSAAGEPETWQPSYFVNWLLHGRGQMRSLRGDLEGALADHLECGRSLAGYDIHNPAEIPWRSRAALANHRLGRTGTAVELATEELELARRWGAPRALGQALRALGRITRDTDLLAESVAVLTDSPAKLARAYSLFHLGLAHHRESRRADARTVLTRAHRLAHECGAHRLAEKAAEAVTRIAGRRPNAPRIGLAALTAQERRIAERAAAGAGNRQIAEELFLTLRTVEQHLTSAYRKLGIDGRRGLAGALRSR
ncbi:ATP-binding protein [Amycolatopsis sp. NPDC059027]|uniref:ATP-binding protein n=1 Tax=Amycolatopsis sp. NPDC059027 TaxID=3346709 RepID=UPI00366DB8E8